MGTLFIITGNGKGKTTSAMGMVARCVGQGGKSFVLQFIKTHPERFGEYQAITSLNVGWQSYGEGFTWKQESLEKTKIECKKGWNRFKSLIDSDLDLIILDEFTYLLKLDLLDKEEVFSFFKELKKRKSFPNIVVTGRDADPKLIEIFDTVSKIENIKHHYESKKQKAQKMIEF